MPGVVRRGPQKCVFPRQVQCAFRPLHYLASQVKLHYGSCSVSYIRRREILQLQRLKSPDGTKHAFVKIHLHYTDFIFPLPPNPTQRLLSDGWPVTMTENLSQKFKFSRRVVMS